MREKLRTMRHMEKVLTLIHFKIMSIQEDGKEISLKAEEDKNLETVRITKGSFKMASNKAMATMFANREFTRASSRREILAEREHLVTQMEGHTKVNGQRGS